MAPPAAPCAPWARRSACPPSLPHCRAPAQPRLFGGKSRRTPNEWRPGLVITARRLPAAACGDEAGGTGLDSSGFVGPPGTAPRRPRPRPRPRPCCCCSCRNGGHLRGRRAPAAGWAPGPRPRTTRRSPRGCGRPGWGHPPTAGAPPEAARRTCPSCPGSAGERPS